MACRYVAVFYGWWDMRFIGLLLGSIAFNYSVDYLIKDRYSFLERRKAI